MKQIDRPSPNHNERPDGRAPDMLVLHYTGMPTAQEAMDRLCDPTAKVSAHYTVDEDGSIYVHAPEDRRAWHAGVSSWQGETDINGASIGIEIVNPGHEFGYRPFPVVQMAAVTALAADVVARYRIHPLRVVGHSDVAPDRKTDPGELFDWPGLAKAGVGVWPDATVVQSFLNDPFIQKPETVGRNLQSIGYDWPADPANAPDDDLIRQKRTAIVAAFQRRFRREAITSEIDAETAALAAAVSAAR